MYYPTTVQALILICTQDWLERIERGKVPKVVFKSMVTYYIIILDI